MTVVVF